jgi:TRAP-type C4-dicarboxylate transport system permease small subunit
MRAVLEKLYFASGVAAAVFLILICVVVSAQIGLRAVDNLLFLLTGTRQGLMIPSAAEFSGFFLAAASFLALAHTLRHGGHIRVNLILRHLPGRVRRLAEAFSLATGAALTGFFAWHTLLMVIDSFVFHEVSYGIVAVPLWIPQSAMLLGLVILFIALVDDLLRALAGKVPSYAGGESAAGAAAGETSEEEA